MSAWKTAEDRLRRQVAELDADNLVLATGKADLRAALEALTAERDRLKAALTPFAGINLDGWGEQNDELMLCIRLGDALDRRTLRLVDLRRARAALADPPLSGQGTS